MSIPMDTNLQAQPTTPQASTVGSSSPSPLANIPMQPTPQHAMRYGNLVSGMDTSNKPIKYSDMAGMLALVQANHHPGYTGTITGSAHIGQQGQATAGSFPAGYDPSKNYGNFLGGQCTSYASWYWTNVLGKPFVDTGNGNARNWPELAKKQGYTVSSTPAAGDIVCWPDMGAYGHVAIVTGINPDGTMNVSEMNYQPGKYTTRSNVSTSGAQFIR